MLGAGFLVMVGCWPGGAVVTDFDEIVGGPSPPFPVFVLPLPLPEVAVGFEVGVTKSGGVPVGVGAQ